MVVKQEQTAAAVAELAVGQQAKRPRTDPADSFGILPRSSTSTITLSTAIAPPLPTAGRAVGAARAARARARPTAPRWSQDGA